ncbi:hypothetical protein [Moorena producens]|uniref:hypothetical protein n=1 Tax=Moorena producens TaxID=1155739 RepID=UPI0011EA6265|nr:hypothetical protein [Moorena producens]
MQSTIITVLDYLFWITYFGLLVPDSRFPIPDSRFPIPDSRFPIPDSRFPLFSPLQTIQLLG